MTAAVHAALEAMIGYAPGQPRVPAGSAAGGQFAGDGGAVQEISLADATTRTAGLLRPGAGSSAALVRSYNAREAGEGTFADKNVAGAVKDYSFGGYDEMNAHLRGQSRVVDEPRSVLAGREAVKDRVADMRQAFDGPPATSLPAGTKLYRGSNDELHRLYPESYGPDFGSTLDPGGTFTDRGFVSVSERSDMAAANFAGLHVHRGQLDDAQAVGVKTVYEISVGSKARVVAGSANPTRKHGAVDESEWILPADSTFRVDAVDRFTNDQGGTVNFVRMTWTGVDEAGKTAAAILAYAVGQARVPAGSSAGGQFGSGSSGVVTVGAGEMHALVESFKQERSTFDAWELAQYRERREGPFSDDEVHRAVIGYTGRDGYEINDDLRARVEVNYGEVSESARLIDRAFEDDGPTLGDSVLYRGGGRGRSLGKDLEIGDEFTDHGFTSATTTGRKALDFAGGIGSPHDGGVVFRVRAGGSMRERSVIAGNMSESEVILPRGAQFEVTGITQFVSDKGSVHRIIDVEWVGVDSDAITAALTAYAPDQPRVPAGSSAGGQFAGDNGGSSPVPDYGISHRPNADGPPANDLLAQGGEWGAPDDIYKNPQFYVGDSNSKAGRETIAAVRAARGAKTVTIYRAADRDEINPGDWVSLSPTYAKQEGLHATDPALDRRVVKRVVPAEHVRWAGDSLDEWGYFPPNGKTAAALLAYAKGQPRVPAGSSHGGEFGSGGSTDAIGAMPDQAGLDAHFVGSEYRLRAIETQEVAYAYQKLGYDKSLPEQASTSDDYSLHERKDVQAVVYRGIGDQSFANAPELADRLISGDHWVGGGRYGDGTYATTSAGEARSYAKLQSGSGGGNMVTIGIKADAKIYDYGSKPGRNQSVTAMRDGAQIMRVTPSDGTNVYFVIFDRSATVMVTEHERVGPEPITAYAQGQARVPSGSSSGGQFAGGSKAGLPAGWDSPQVGKRIGNEMRFGKVDPNYVPPETLKIQGKWKADARDGTVQVRINHGMLAHVLDQGRFKNQHEAGHSNGLYNPEKRKAFEEAMFGDELGHGQIYGYINPAHYGGKINDQVIWQYGDVVVNLKAGVAKRTTVTIGDSLNLDDPPAPISFGAFKTARGRRLNDASYDIEMPERIAKGANYIEAQIHGGVSLADVASLRVDSYTFGRMPQSTLDKIDELKIPFEIVDEGDL